MGEIIQLSRTSGHAAVALLVTAAVHHHADDDQDDDDGQDDQSPHESLGHRSGFAAVPGHDLTVVAGHVCQPHLNAFQATAEGGDDLVLAFRADGEVVIPSECPEDHDYEFATKKPKPISQ